MCGPAMTGLFSAWREWRERRAILRDIARQQGDARERNRFVARDLLEEALAAIDLNDRRKGAAIWTDVVQRYPQEIRTSPLALKVMLKLHRYDEADALMREGRKKRPRDSYFAKGLAEVAAERGDYDAAIEHCAALRKQFPGVTEGYTLGAQALARKDRLDEASALAEQAMKLFPEEIRGFLEYSHLPERRGDWTEALRRWQIVEDTFTDRAFGSYGRAQALIKLERYDEADEVLAAGRFRFPTESGLLTELARCAQARGNVPEAVKRWKYRIERVPMETWGYSGAVEAFKEMGEYAEAEAMIRAAIERFPLEEYPTVMLCEFLRDRNDLSGEMEAWALLRQNFPDNEAGYTWGAYALRRAGQTDRADALLEEHKNRFQH
jgi:predicted Zn-dependent protease